MAEWISVKDRLPDKDGKYLCFSTNGNFIDVCGFAKSLHKVDKYDFKGIRRKGWYTYSGEWGYYEISCITHWMPIPELPKEC